MKRTAFTIVAAILLLAAAVPAAQAAEQSPRIAALQVRVLEKGAGDVRFRPIDERIQLEAGKEYRISLVGTESLSDHRGDIGINAHFAEAAGRGAISLGNSEGNWVIVQSRPNANGNAEISYQVQGNYNMPAAWRTGRIRFDLVRQVGQGNGNGNGYGYGNGGGQAASGLAVRVENLTTGRTEFVDLGGNERIPLDRGERVRISLVDARRNPVDADFDLANRPGAQIERTGDNWVILRGLDDSGRVQLTYNPESSRYNSGRIGFVLGEDNASNPGNPGNVTDQDRWSHAQDLTAMLYRAVLLQDPRSENQREFRRDVQRVYDQGYEGLRALARDLAQDAQNRRIFSNRRDSEVVGMLYRDLLGRTGTNDELYRGDAGFRRFVDTLDDRNGLVTVVDAIVGSQEFRQNHDLDDYGLMRSARY